MKHALIATLCILLISSCNKDSDSNTTCYLATAPFVYAQGGAKFLLPTAFTPNGDGKNDVFRPVGLTGITNFSMTILDNVGNTVFRTIDLYTSGWDGRSNNGALLQEGNYAVSFQFNTVNGDAVSQQVCVALLEYGAGNCIQRSGVGYYYFEDQIDVITPGNYYTTTESICP